MRFGDDVPPRSRLFRCEEQDVGALHPLHRRVLPHRRNLGIGEVHGERVEVTQFLEVPVGKLRGLCGGDGARGVRLHTNDVALRLLRGCGKRNQEKYCRKCATFHIGVLTWMGGAVYQIKNAAPEGRRVRKGEVEKERSMSATAGHPSGYGSDYRSYARAERRRIQLLGCGIRVDE